jgi:hypothetical protein
VTAVDDGGMAVTLREYFDARLADASRETAGRFAAMEKATASALAAAEKATGAALDAAQRAVEKAETASEKRFEGVNEFRAALSDQTSSLMPRAEAESRFHAIESKIDALASRMDRNEGRGSGLGAGWSYLIGAVGLIGSLIAIVLVLMN